MLCDELKSRLDELLDQRRSIDADPLAAAHLTICDDCRRYASMIEAIADIAPERTIPEPTSRLADNVVRAMHKPEPVVRSNFWTIRDWAWIAAPMAVAAALLVMALPRFFGLDQGAHPIEIDTIVDGNSSSMGSGGSIEGGGSMGGGSLIASKDPTAVTLDSAAMWRITGEQLALLPDRVRLASHVAEPVVDGIRPVTNSVSAAIDAIRGTMPRATDPSI